MCRTGATVRGGAPPVLVVRPRVRVRGALAGVGRRRRRRRFDLGSEQRAGRDAGRRSARRRRRERGAGSSGTPRTVCPPGDDVASTAGRGVDAPAHRSDAHAVLLRAAARGLHLSAARGERARPLQPVRQLLGRAGDRGRDEPGRAPRGAGDRRRYRPRGRACVAAGGGRAAVAARDDRLRRVLARRSSHPDARPRPARGDALAIGRLDARGAGLDHDLARPSLRPDVRRRPRLRARRPRRRGFTGDGRVRAGRRDGRGAGERQPQPGRRRPGRRVRSGRQPHRRRAGFPGRALQRTTRTAGPWRCSTPTCSWWRRSPISAATPAHAASRLSARRRPTDLVLVAPGAGGSPRPARTQAQRRRRRARARGWRRCRSPSRPTARACSWMPGTSSSASAPTMFARVVGDDGQRQRPDRRVGGRQRGGVRRLGRRAASYLEDGRGRRHAGVRRRTARHPRRHRRCRRTASCSRSRWRTASASCAAPTARG